MAARLLRCFSVRAVSSGQSNVLFGLFAALLAASWGCVNPAGLDRRPCPCTTGFACCAASNACVSPAVAGSSACTRGGLEAGIPPDAPLDAPSGADGRAPDAPGGEGRGDGGNLAPDLVSPAPDAAAEMARDVAAPDLARADLAAAELPSPLPEPPVDRAPPAECTPQATRCASASTLQSCDASGRWVNATECALGCRGGACAVCAAPAGRCAGNAPESCSAMGQWVAEPACLARSACSVGTCVCNSACDEGELHAPPTGLVALAVGGDSLYYHDGEKLRRLALSSGQLTEPFPLDATRVPVGELAADEVGTVYWCRREVATDTAVVMKNGAVFEPMPCSRLRLGATHLYFAGNVDIHRRPLGAGSATMVASGILTAFDVDGSSVYHGSRARAFTQVIKTPLANSMGSTTLFEQLLEPITSLAVDGRTVYFAAGRAVYRIPAAGGTLDPFSEASDRAKLHVALTDSHVYWTSAAINGDTGGCTTTTVFRRAKTQPAGGPAEELTAGHGGACPVALVAHGRHLYLGLDRSRDPSGAGPRIIRIRQ